MEQTKEQTPIEMLMFWATKNYTYEEHRPDEVLLCINLPDLIEKATKLLAAEKERELLIASKSWDAAREKAFPGNVAASETNEVFMSYVHNKKEYLKSLTK